MAALKESCKLASAFTPLLEIPPIPLKYIEGQDEPVLAKSIDDHMADVAERFVETLKGLPRFFVDGIYIENEDELTDGAEPIESVFNALRAEKLAFVPTCALNSVEDYVESVRTAVSVDGRGCCLRLFEADLEGIAEIELQVGALLKFLGILPRDIDLLVDFGPKVPSKAALPYQVDALPFLTEWRTVTVAASSFPVDMSGVAQNSIAELEREEWLAWVSLRSKSKVLKRMPTYGDYAINHPVYVEVDPRIINMSPNIRYTDSASYVIAKGQAIPRKKKSGTPEEQAKRRKLLPSEQYPKLAAKIMAHPSWKGVHFSWGDAFIEDCARKSCVGNPTDWRAVGTCHHIALVSQQLSSLP